MFCKWCGKTIQITDVNCPNCGRETPPLSDCGGFYNLKAPDGTIPQSKVNTVPESKVNTVPVVERIYINDRKADKAHHKLTVIFFGVVSVLITISFVLGILAAAKIGDATEQVVQIQKDMDAFEEILLEVSQTIETIPEPSTIPVPEETIPEETEPVKEPNAVTVTEEVSELGETVFVVLYQNDIELFADGEITYLWQYSKETDIWQNVDEDLCQLNEDGTSALACTEAFSKRIDAQEQRIELRCVIQCTNESGDTMEICVRGMFIGEETSDIVIDENVASETTDGNNIEQ